MESESNAHNRGFVLLKWALLVVMVASFLFYITVAVQRGTNVKFATYIATYNLVIYFSHIYRRGESWETYSNNEMPFLYAFHSSKVRALAIANISFFAYYSFFWISNQIITTIECTKTDELSTCVFNNVWKVLVAEAADLFSSDFIHVASGIR